MSSKHFRPLILFLATAVTSIAVITMLGPSRSLSQTATGPKCGPACWQAKVDRHLALMGEFNNEEALQASLRDLMSGGDSVVRVTQDTYNQWTRPENYNPRATARPAEMRWRATYLLGSLGVPDAIPFLYEIAKKPLPEPTKGEIPYGDEYRICLRAIVGLEQLKAIDELKNLYEMGGVLRNPAAASLFVLGTNVGGVKRVDVKRALADDVADYKDFKPGKGRPPQIQKPGRERINPTRRPDTPLTIKQTRGD